MDYLDLLAKLGIGNAHPGGFAASVKQLEQYPPPANSRILEVGCGTGRTACYAASLGHNVTGIDIRSDMIKKAKLRAEQQSVPVRFLEGDACSLPFPDGSFDVILVESVSIFTNTEKALSEYYRVLRAGGKLFDREIVQRAPIPLEGLEQISRFYQVEKLMQIDEWSSMAASAGFHPVQIDGPFPFPPGDEQLADYPDHHQQIDAGSLLDHLVWEVTNEYNSIMERYRACIGYILLIGIKPR